MTPGTPIGNYVLAELLDQGGRGQVWLAHREFAGGGRAAVAIKFPHGAGVPDSGVRDRLLFEARLQMQMQHSNIPRVVDMGVHEGLPYLVTDFIAGHSLAQLLARMRDFGTRMRFELVAHVAREVGYALRYAHGCEVDGVARGVIHGDVDPKNVLVSSQGAVYVVGFGGSEAVGSLLYMAPEQAQGFPTPESDGWGLGAILWEMIEGRQLRAEGEADELHRAASEGHHEPLARVGIPEALRLVTEGLLRVDERERLTLDEVLRPLETQEFPVQRTALADLVERCFGGLVHPAGQMLPVGDARPAGEASGDARPAGEAAQGEPAGDDALLPPPPAWGSMSEPPAEPAKPRAPSVAAAPDPEPVEAEPPPPAPPAAAAASPVELHADAPPRKKKVPLAWVAVVGLVGVGVGWAVWPRGTDPEATAPTAVEPPKVVVSPVVPAPAPVHPQPEVGPPPVVPEVVVTPPPVDPPVEPSPAVEPSPVPPAVPPTTTPQAGSKPVRKKPADARRPTQLTIALLLFADMDVEVNGVHFSLGVRKPTAKTTVTSGQLRVRWRRPLGKWKSKTFPIEPGSSYEVRVDDRGPKLKKKAS